MRNKKYFLNILIILLIGGTSIYLSIGEQFDQEECNKDTEL